MLEMASEVGGLLAAIVLLLACFGCSYLLAARSYSAAPTSARLSAATLIALWLLVASFYLLAAFGLFRIYVALPGWCLACGLLLRQSSRRATAVELAQADFAQAREGLRALRQSPWRWVCYAAGALVAARLIRGMVAPPLAWDALTYHLVKAARWVQTGGFTHEAAPDAWGFYEYFSPTGDILWGWAMLPVHGDALLAVAGVLIWAAGLLVAYAAGRSFGTPRSIAATVALVIGLTPGVIHYVTSNYTDNTTLLFFLCSLLFLHRALNEGTAADCLLAAGALGLLASTRPFFPPVAALGLVLLVIVSLRAERPLHRRLALVGACTLAATVALPPYLHAWVDRGSPLYPYELQIGSILSLPGNDEFAYLHSGRSFPDLRFSYRLLFRTLFWPGSHAYGKEHLNFGPVAPVFLLVGVIGLARALFRRRTRAAAVFAACVVTLIVAGLMSPGALTTRTAYSAAIGRYLAPVLAALALFAAHLGGRRTLPLWMAAAVLHLALAIPYSWSVADLHAVAELLLSLIPVLAALAIISLWAPLRQRPRVALALGVASMAALAPPWHAARERHRYRIYEAAAANASYDAHRLWPRYVKSFPIWAHFDGERPQRIAIAAGWDGFSTNWYRYPFFGSRLQNEIVYVTPTDDGSIVNYWRAGRLRKKASLRAWVARLLAADAGFLVTLPPEPIESGFVRQAPQLFEPVAEGVGRFARAYRFRRDLATPWLAQQPEAPDMPTSEP